MNVTLVLFLIVVGITLVITGWAASKTRSKTAEAESWSPTRPTCASSGTRSWACWAIRRGRKVSAGRRSGGLPASSSRPATWSPRDACSPAWPGDNEAAKPYIDLRSGGRGGADPNVALAGAWLVAI